MQTLAHIKALLAEHGLEPKKSLGQNFLVDHNLLRKLVDAGLAPLAHHPPHSSAPFNNLPPLILEVGPGTGVLTDELLERLAATSSTASPGTLIACELDDTFAALLQARAAAMHAAGDHRLVVVHADCLGPDRRLNPLITSALPPARPFRLIANLPYAAATPLITSLLLDHPLCELLAVTIQREVADRLAAAPSTKEFGGLSVVAQALTHVRRLATLPRECFWPRPDVTSAMVVLERRAQPLSTNPHALSDFCRVIFAQRRKQLGSLLARAAADSPFTAPAAWPDAITPTMRAEQLSVPQIEALRLACTPTPSAA